jgi:hypothetical protein
LAAGELELYIQPHPVIRRDQSLSPPVQQCPSFPTQQTRNGLLPTPIYHG